MNSVGQYGLTEGKSEFMTSELQQELLAWNCRQLLFFLRIYGINKVSFLLIYPRKKG